MMRIKYVLENQNDVLEPSEDTLMYLPIKIGEFSVDHVDNSMHFQKSKLKILNLKDVRKIL